MGRTIASVVAALAIIAVTVILLPSGTSDGDGAGPGVVTQAPGPDGVPSAAGPDGAPSGDAPVGFDDDPFVEPEGGAGGDQALPDDQEALVEQACRKHADMLIARRGTEAADKLGSHLKMGLGFDKTIEFCKGLDGLSEDEQLARIDALLAN